ncbi:N-acetylmannosamine-6-phosphate 2-epimerase [Neobacillus muris]|uniref:N-acetylmannosamine-6-phosphate 2-epimerase n=1 Tax=Neobacillus muris TaxID=2941334 RepID=UPI00203BB984|nr:N-acetylmannosamine-6-phosphate 2-epimerase [Neobacillus muris]
MNPNNVLEQMKGKLIVSCQALPEEPLHSPFIMGRMAYAAMLGGAAGIRANSVEDIKEIKKNVDLPIIGIIKRVMEGSDVFITPTLEEIELLYQEGVDIIALDATARVRPVGKTIQEIFPLVREKYPNQLFMADCSTFEEAKLAYELGFDCVGTTLIGYTDYTKGHHVPDLDLIERMAKEIPVPVIAEGGIWSPDDLKAVFDHGAYTAVVGSAFTRPMEITKRFIEAIR